MNLNGSNRLKTYMTRRCDEGGERRSHGYPDECYSLTTFADSLVALAWGYGWIMQPPIVDLRNAIVVDFISDTQSHAESSIAHGWNGSAEHPMGSVNTVYGRTETNEQNARIERHLLLLGTAMTHGDFHRQVIEKLLDHHSCKDPACSICEGRFLRGIGSVFQILADGTNQIVVHLFSKWKPDEALLRILAADRIELRWRHLSEIDTPALEANRFYSIWDGSVEQAGEFLQTIWAPAWMGNPAD